MLYRFNYDICYIVVFEWQFSERYTLTQKYKRTCSVFGVIEFLVRTKEISAAINE